MSWRVGGIARETGVTIRTLHYYEEIGLLIPSGRSEAGHRLYGASEIRRLHQIRALQQAGFRLAEIRQLFEEEEFSPKEVVEQQLDRLEGEIDLRRRLAGRLRGLLRYMESDPGEAPAERFLETMRMMKMLDKHYTKEQLETLEKRREELGADTIKAVEAEWPVLIAAVKEEMEKGTDPADGHVQTLVARWRELVEMFTGGDVGIAASVGRVYRDEPQIRQKTGLTAEIMAYVAKAQGAASSSEADPD